jgi:hypothetical protein
MEDAAMSATLELAIAAPQLATVTSIAPISDDALTARSVAVRREYYTGQLRSIVGAYRERASQREMDEAMGGAV